MAKDVNGKIHFLKILNKIAKCHLLEIVTNKHHRVYFYLTLQLLFIAAIYLVHSLSVRRTCNSY